MHQFLIDFINTVTDAQINEYMTTYGATVVSTFDNFEKIYVVSTEADTLPLTDIIEKITYNDELDLIISSLIIEPYKYSLHSDPALPQLRIQSFEDKDWWKNTVITHPRVEDPYYDLTLRGEEGVVYLMDSGINKTHPDLTDTIIQDLYSVSDNFNDSLNHGTGLASIIAGATAGITNATIKNVKIKEQGYTTKVSDLLKSFDAIISDIALQDSIPAVVNCSWNIPKNTYIEEKIRILLQSGVHIVCAAGNDNTEVSGITPASMPEVITVAAHNVEFMPAVFTNYSFDSLVDGFAPGTHIYVADNATNDFSYKDGTSASAAITSAALIYNLCAISLGEPIRPVYRNQNVSFITTHCLNRTNLIDTYIDYKYSTIPSLSPMLYNEIQIPPVSSPLSTSRTLKAIVGQTAFYKVYNPRTTARIEVIGDLPEGATFTKHGILEYTPLTIAGDYAYNGTVIVRELSNDQVESEYSIRIFAVMPSYVNQTGYDDAGVEVTFVYGGSITECWDFCSYTGCQATYSDYCYSSGGKGCNCFL